MPWHKSQPFPRLRALFTLPTMPDNTRSHLGRPLFLTIHWWRPWKVNKTWFSHNPDSPRSSHSSNTTQNKELALSQPGNIHWIWASHALWLFFHRPHVGAFEAEAWEQLVAHYASNVNIISHTRFSDNRTQIILRITYWKGFGYSSASSNDPSVAKLCCHLQKKTKGNSFHEQSCQILTLKYNRLIKP